MLVGEGRPIQTFLPHPSFVASARCLDTRRLGKQRVEAHQLLSACEGQGGWANHPAAKMWRGYRVALMLYRDIVIREWCRRGFNNSMHTLLFLSPDSEVPQFVADIEMPPWLGREDLHASHRSNLLRKDPDHYGQFGWEEPDDMEYVWP